MNGNPALTEQAERTQRLAEQLDQSIDFLTAQLRPAALEHLGLSAALQTLVEANLYRIVQEALANVSSHAHATQVTVSMERRDHGTIVVIEDNGRGFDGSKPADDHASRLGLLSMRERAMRAGGRLDIESTPGMGTAIVVRIPAAPSTAE